MTSIKFKITTDMSDSVSIAANDSSDQYKSINQLKAETVEKHPLARSSSNSSSSSVELDANETTIQNKKKTRTPSVGRFRDFLSRSDESSKTDSADGSNVYYNLWHNKAKILNNWKKQATESVRSLTQSASLDNTFNQGFLYKTHDSSGEASRDAKQLSNMPTSQSGLIKVTTEDITESPRDDEVSAYLESFQQSASDPLTALQQKKEEEKNDDLLEVQESTPNLRFRSLTTNSLAPTPSPREKNRRSSSSRKPTAISPSSTKGMLAVSLSSLMAGGNDNPDDEIETTDTEVKDHSAFKNAPANAIAEKSSVNVRTRKEIAVATADHPSPSITALFVCSLLVYSFLILPLPQPLRIACSCFIIGCFFTAAFLCIVAPRSSRPASFLPPLATIRTPHPVPLSIYDPDQPIKGWMNELTSYDPDTYHISNTQSVYVTLDGATLRLQTPSKNVAKRSIYNEGSIPISNVVHQRLFDITFAKVFLQPSGLVKKRVWSKKYPICVEIPREKTHDLARDFKESPSNPGEGKTIEPRIVYLFGRTDRQKEEWFYRIQRSINIALSRHNKTLKVAKVKLSESDTQPLVSEDEWGIIENIADEDAYVSSNVSDITKLNDQPIRVLQDYFVHVSRLFPQPECKPDSVKLQRSKPDEKKSDDHQVSWLNVLVGRIVFDFLRQRQWTEWLSGKVQRKLDKIKLPYFMDGLKLTGMDLGSSVPLVHEISLPKLDAQGIWFDAEVTYSGSAQMTLETKLVLTKLGKNETALLERYTYNRTEAATDSDAEDSAESSEDEPESAVSRIMGQVQQAVSRIDGPQLLKDAVKAVGKEPVSAESYALGSSPPVSDQPPTSGAPPKKWLRIVDSITKSKYFQKAAESDYIRKKLESVSNTPMLLTVELHQLKGTLVINIPPPPTDRIWYGFREPPLMHLKAQPKVGERVVKTTHVTDWIENKLQQEVTKFLVMPNMDDIPIPIMYHNRSQPT